MASRESRPGGAFLRFLLLASCCLLLVSGWLRAEENYPDFVEEVFLTKDQALRKVFPEAGHIAEETVRLSSEQKIRVERRTGWRLTDEPYTIHKGLSADGRALGYAVVAEEIGKYKPITFLVKSSPDFRVEHVEVMVYREPRGGEVRKARFLHQFKNKSAKSPLRINRDIINITGATLSVRAMSAGVKRVMCVLEEVYGQPQKR